MENEHDINNEGDAGNGKEKQKSANEVINERFANACTKKDDVNKGSIDSEDDDESIEEEGEGNDEADDDDAKAFKKAELAIAETDDPLKKALDDLASAIFQISGGSVTLSDFIRLNGRRFIELPLGEKGKSSLVVVRTARK